MATETEVQPARTFLQERTGWQPLKQFLLLEPLPGGARWTAAFGSLLLFAFLLQVVTGILLAMNFAASADTAYASVRFIQEEVPWGRFIRALHHWGSSAMVILLLVHIVQVFVWGAYKRPRELTWMVGVLLLMCTLGLAFTGYLLPWDQKAYWATKVGLGIVSTIPFIGDSLQTLLQGGSDLGNLTLTRFFAIHGFVLPGLLIGLVVVHLYLFRLHGVTPSWWYSREQLQKRAEPFWPRQAFMDAVFALAFLIALGCWSYFRSAPLEAQADPSQPYAARPEWYFMVLFQILRYFHGPYEIVGTFVLPVVFFVVLLFWPLLDRNPSQAPRRRPIAIGLLILGAGGLVGMTIYANVTDVRMEQPASVAAAEKKSEPAGPLQKADVTRLYTANCYACHGVDGSGNQLRRAMPTIPDFTSLAWQTAQTDVAIIHQIEAGKVPLMPAFQDKLKHGQILALAVYVRAFALSPASGTVAAAAVVPAPSASAMSPTQIYSAYCLACHDRDGQGTIVRAAMKEIPNFDDPKWQASRPNTELLQSILNGKGKFMLPMKDKLSPSDAQRMIGYIRGFQGGKQVIAAKEPPPAPPPLAPVIVPRPLVGSADPAAVARARNSQRLQAAAGLFGQYCLVCHGTDGRGNAMRTSMPQIPRFPDPNWQSGLNDAQMVASILNGKNGLMPAFSGRVDEDQARDLVAFIRAFGPAPAPSAAGQPEEFEQRYRQLEAEWNRLQKQLDAIKPAPK